MHLNALQTPCQYSVLQALVCRSSPAYSVQWYQWVKIGSIVHTPCIPLAEFMQVLLQAPDDGCLEQLQCRVTRDADCVYGHAEFLNLITFGLWHKITSKNT